MALNRVAKIAALAAGAEAFRLDEMFLQKTPPNGAAPANDPNAQQGEDGGCCDCGGENEETASPTPTPTGSGLKVVTGVDEAGQEQTTELNVEEVQTNFEESVQTISEMQAKLDKRSEELQKQLQEVSRAGRNGAEVLTRYMDVFRVNINYDFPDTYLKDKEGKYVGVAHRDVAVAEKTFAELEKTIKGKAEGTPKKHFDTLKKEADNSLTALVRETALEVFSAGQRDGASDFSSSFVQAERPTDRDTRFTEWVREKIAGFATENRDARDLQGEAVEYVQKVFKNSDWKKNSLVLIDCTVASPKSWKMLEHELPCRFAANIFLENEAEKNTFIKNKAPRLSTGIFLSTNLAGVYKYVMHDDLREQLTQYYFGKLRLRVLPLMGDKCFSSEDPDCFGYDAIAGRPKNGAKILRVLIQEKYWGRTPSKPHDKVFAAGLAPWRSDVAFVYGLLDGENRINTANGDTSGLGETILNIVMSPITPHDNLSLYLVEKLIMLKEREAGDPHATIDTLREKLHALEENLRERNEQLEERSRGIVALQSQLEQAEERTRVGPADGATAYGQGEAAATPPSALGGAARPPTALGGSAPPKRSF